MEPSDDITVFGKQLQWIKNAVDAIKSGHSLPPLTHPQGGAVGALISSLVDLWEKQRNTLRQISEFKAKEMEYIEASMMDSTRVKEATEKEKQAAALVGTLETEIKSRDLRVRELQNAVHALKDHIHQLKNELDKNTATFTNLKEQMALQESRHQDELASKEEGFQKQLQDQKTRLEKELANTKEIRSQAVDLERKVEDISEQFTEERQALQSIVKIGELMSVSLRPEEIARRACQIPLNFIGCKRSFTFLRDPDSDCFVPVHGLGFDRSGMTLLKATKLRAGEFPILTDLFQRKSAVLIDDCRKSPNEGKVHIGDGQVETFRCATPLLSDAYIERFQIYSLLAIPFISKGELTGVMFVDFGLVRHRFSSVEILAMDGLGQLIGISLDNIYTHQDTSKRLLALERQARTTSALEEIEEAVASTNQTERMIETVLSEAPRVIGCEGVSVLLADKQAGGFYVLGDLENLKRNEGIIPFVQTSFHGILRADQILYRPNLESEGGLARLDLDLLKHGIGSDLLLPLSGEGDVMGTLHFSSRRVAGFTHDDIQVGQKIAETLSGGLKRSIKQRGKDRRKVNGYYDVIRKLIDSVSQESFLLGDYRDQMIRCGLEISRGLNLDEEQQEWIKYAIVLHDIGKSTIPDHILNKKEKLTEKEMAVLKSHPVSGAEVLKNLRFSQLIKGLKFVKFVAPLTRHCYEHWDGTGYPDGLKGNDIPVGSRILAVVNAYAAMLTDRPYRKALPADQAIREIKAGSGKLFDPAVVELFLSHLEKTDHIHT